MRPFLSVGFIAAAIVLVSVGSQAQQSTSNQPAPQATKATTMSAEDVQKEADIQASLAKLSREDRKLAEAQKFCPVMIKDPLGVMGRPVKVMIKDKPVFLCCKGCQTKALANPDKTLASVAALLKANAKPESTKK